LHKLLVLPAGEGLNQVHPPPDLPEGGHANALLFPLPSRPVGRVQDELAAALALPLQGKALEEVAVDVVVADGALAGSAPDAVLILRLAPIRPHQNITTLLLPAEGEGSMRLVLAVVALLGWPVQRTWVECLVALGLNWLNLDLQHVLLPGLHGVGVSSPPEPMPRPL
jgi:hypothetical protein